MANYISRYPMRSLFNPLLQQIITRTLHVSVAWVVLSISLFITGYIWQVASDDLASSAQSRFERRVEEVTGNVIKRMQDYEQVLRGARGLFVATDRVTRQQWRAYTESLRIDEHYPGIQGIGFSQHIPAAGKEAHVQSLRKEGFTQYDIRPPGAREEYTAIIYLEPFDWRNQRAFGYDMFSEPTRRAAMERARDTGDTAISGKVTLVQEEGKEKQAGILMYLPVYRNGEPVDTVAQRRAAFVGYVYSPFRMNNLMNGILGKHQSAKSDVDIEVFDGSHATADALLYDDDRVLRVNDPARKSQHARTVQIELNSRPLTLYFTASPAFYAAIDEIKPWRLLITGVSFSLLLFGLVRLLATRRQRAQALADVMSATARTQAERIGAILRNIVDGIITINDRGGIESVNPAVEKIFGFTAAEMVGRNVNILMPDPYHHQRDAYLNRYLESAENTINGSGREVTGQRVDGTTFPLELAISELRINDERLFIGVVRDLTERKKIDRLKSEFVATVSHELRTPLTAISGSLGLISGGVTGELPAKAQQLISVAHRNSERLVRLVNDILDIEKLEAGKMQMNLATKPLWPLVQQAMEANSGYAAQHQVKLNLTGADGGVHVRVDTDRLAQVMANLLSNAIKYSPPQGTVDVNVSQSANQVRVSVRDRGPGIPEAFQERIFKRFSRADSTDTRQKGGTGLGIILRLGGQIGYESVSGEGATFYFTLPTTDKFD